VSWFRRFELAAQEATDPEYRAEKYRSHAATVRDFEGAFLEAYTSYRNIYWVGRLFKSRSLTRSFLLGRTVLTVPPELTACEYSFLSDEHVNVASILELLTVDLSTAIRMFEVFATALCKSYDRSKANPALQGLARTDEARNRLRDRAKEDLKDNAQKSFEELVQSRCTQLRDPSQFDRCLWGVIREILRPEDPNSLGVLTPEASVRLLKHYRALASPWAEPAIFDQARKDVDQLQELVKQAGGARGWDVHRVCRAMTDLGGFARQVKAVFLGGSEETRRHRQEVGHLLSNLDAIGLLTARVIDAAVAWDVWDSPASIKPPPPAPSGESASQAPPSHVRRDGDVAPESEESAALRELRRIVETAKASWFRSAQEHGWQALTRLFETLKTRSEELQDRLRQPGSDPGQIAASGCERLIQCVRDLDKVLPAKTCDGEGYLDPPPYASMRDYIRETRDMLLKFAGQYGKFREYAIQPGERASKHLGKYHEPLERPYYDRSTGDPIIERVMSPGYCRGDDPSPFIRALVIIRG
jgi:hypothetical protein